MSEVFFSYSWSVGEVWEAAVREGKGERYGWKLRAFEFVAIDKQAANLATLAVKRVVARAHAHSVMPRHWKNPPHQRSQNGLSHSEWDNVAFS